MLRCARKPALRFATALFTFFATFCTTVYAQSLVFPIDPANDIVGNLEYAMVMPDQDVTDLSLHYHVGYFDLREANPDIDFFHLTPYTKILLPTRYILPDAPRSGVIVNLSEMRLYYYPEHKKEVQVYPIAIGRSGPDWQTPVGMYRITQKREKPTWVVPNSIREYRAKQGVLLPKVVPPGPDNPLGEYALRLNGSTLLIHGTNDLNIVGRRETSGCMRMYPKDIEHIFKQVKVNSSVHIINQPHKIGFDASGNMYLESHQPVTDGKKESHDNYTPVIQRIVKLSKEKSLTIDWEKVERVMLRKMGVPERISVLRGDVSHLADDLPEKEDTDAAPTEQEETPTKPDDTTPAIDELPAEDDTPISPPNSMLDAEPINTQSLSDSE